MHSVACRLVHVIHLCMHAGNPALTVVRHRVSLLSHGFYKGGRGGAGKRRKWFMESAEKIRSDSQLSQYEEGEETSGISGEHPQ